MTIPPRSRWFLHRGFQLKYSLLLVAVGAILMAALGFVLDRTAEAALENAKTATEQATHALVESQSNTALAKQNITLVSQDNPELAKMLTASLGEDELKARESAAALTVRAQDLTKRITETRVVMLVSFGVVLVLLFLAGIFVTQRLVQPVMKMKRLLRRVSTGRLLVREKHKKGDDLEDLFETFVQMTNSLRALERARLATLKATLKDAELTNADETVIEGLHALRLELEPGLGMEALMRRSQTSFHPEKL
jgi:nitrogen fixation/metabolism regulation signal transduction histidine kinase